MKRIPLSHARQGQLVGQVFIFIIGAFVMGAIMLLGYRAVKTVNEQRCTAQQGEFEHALQDALSNNLAKGKVRTLPFTLPCGATEVCFVSRSLIDSRNSAAIESIRAVPKYAVIANSIEGQDQSNVFIRGSDGYSPMKLIEEPAPIGDTPSSVVPANIVCIEGTDIDLRFQGTGQSVLVGTP